MSRYVVNDILWGDPEDVRDEADGEIMLCAPIIQEQELNLDPLIEVFVEKIWGHTGVSNAAFEEAIREWGRQNRKFVQPRLNKIAWDPDGVSEHGHPPGKSNFCVYLFVEDRCADSFYGSGETEHGTEIYRNDDRNETTVLTINWQEDQSIEDHDAFVKFTIDALNAAHIMQAEPGVHYMFTDDGAGLRMVEV